MSPRVKSKSRSRRRGAIPKARSRAIPAPQDSALRLDTIGKVAAVLSHESRNLLGALGTCVQVLRRNPHLTADDLEMLDILQSGGRRLSEIIGQFAAFRRAGIAGNPVDLHALLQEILTRLCQDERCSAQIVIQRRFDPEIKFVSADADGLRQALWELCLNGAQAIGKQGTLEISTRQTGKNIIIAVSDSGRGIDPAVAQDIFEPLFTTKTRATGLGLAIVKRVVEDHRGTVLLKNASARGAIFVVTLPRSHIRRKQPARDEVYHDS